MSHVPPPRIRIRESFDSVVREVEDIAAVQTRAWSSGGKGSNAELVPMRKWESDVGER